MLKTGPLNWANNTAQPFPQAQTLGQKISVEIKVYDESNKDDAFLKNLII